LLLIRKPSVSKILKFLDSQKGEAFSYAEVGASRLGAPQGATLDHHRVRLGSGEAVHRRAIGALRRWRMFDLGWLELHPFDASIEPGTTVAVLVRWSAFWFLNAARVVYVVEEESPVRRFGFAYGTLPEHAESGEERFSIEGHADGSVWYDVLAFSRPHQWMARLCPASCRELQLRFARDSMAAMVRAVGAPEG
jgi:uncharacterized protein (UPF0548 family)